MEKILDFFLSNIPQTIGILMMVVMLTYLAIQAHQHKTDLWSAIEGEDGKLQLPEVVMALWVVLFPVIVLANLFLDRHPDPAIMISMDVILAIILGVKQYKAAKGAVLDKKDKEEGENGE